MADNWKELSENNMGLVHLAAYRNKNKLDKYSVYKFEDLIAEGNLALVNAAKNFNPDNGAAFSSYAYACIDGAMKKFINKVTPVATFNCRASELAPIVVRDDNEYKSTDELMEIYQINKTTAYAVKLFIKNKYYTSLNEKADADDPDELTDLFAQYHEDYNSKVAFNKFYDRLTEKEKKVVVGRIIGKSNLEIGKDIGTSREMVRLHIKKIRRKFDSCFA